MTEAAEAAAARGPRRRPWMLLGVAGLLLLVLAWAAALAAALWASLDPEGRAAAKALLAPRVAIVALFVLLLPALLWAALRPFVAAWPRAAARLREEVDIVAGAHAAHRVGVPPGAAAELRELALALDALARAHAALHAEVDARIAEAGARQAADTRRLAALMAQLPQGVLVCNRDERVLLYNDRAAWLLGGADPAAAPGLGRPLAGCIDADVLAHARQRLERRRAQGDAEALVRFVTARADGTLLRVQMAPIGGEGREGGEGTAPADGHVLIVDDVTRSVHEQGRRDARLQRLTEGLRPALANLSAAAQTMHLHPAMDAAQRQRFTTVVHDEAARLAQLLAQALQGDEAADLPAWPREDVQLGDLVAALQQRLRAELAVGCSFDGALATRWLAADSHALVQLLVGLATRLVQAVGCSSLEVEADGAGRFLRLDLCWAGPPLPPEHLQRWEGERLAAGTVRAVLDRHGAECWSPSGVAGGRQRLCLQLPALAEAGGPDEPAGPLPGGRPVSYDFDLFHQAGQTEALDRTPLAALACTVFDTETTGLRPSEGDEIIAIGAVRIVNQRVLEHERFDRLVCPRRPVRPSAFAVHGIGMERLAGEPPLEQVLPVFARFCEGTVLVAHNAAFDLRFLELARERTGVRFDHPVLDTLLLSAVVHPGHGRGEHHLEQIAARLGVPVDARHQALGDALVTAGVFLKLLPLLAERGIHTLGQAREASRRTAEAGERF